MEELENQPTMTFLFNSEQYGVPIEGGKVNLQAVAEHFGVPTSALQAQTKTGPRALLCESDGMSKISTWEDGTSVTCNTWYVFFDFVCTALIFSSSNNERR